MKTRWFNFRPLCVIFLFLLLGSIFSFYVYKFTFLTIIIFIMVIIFILVLGINKKNIYYILIPILAFCVGFSLYNISNYKFNKEIKQPLVCSARIYNIKKEYNKNIIVYAEDCKFDGKQVDTNLIINIYDSKGLFNDILVGNYIVFPAESYEKVDLNKYDIPNATYIKNNLKYQINVNIEDIVKTKNKLTIDELIRDFTKSSLSKGLSNENTEIAYSALFGDKTLLSESIYDSYKLSGVAHLLAVSGLHVGIIVGIINWIGKKSKTKKWVTFTITLIFLLLYMYLCDYSSSVVRASIMSLTLMLAPLCFRESDPLSAISLAGIINFIINPFCVFEVGFLLSYSSVLGIIMLSKPIRNAIVKKKTKNVIFDAISISTATNVSIMIIMAYFFRNLNIISLISNIILIPIFTLVFTFVFVVSILSLIIPFLGHILIVANPIFDFINLIANVLAGLPISNFATMNISYFSIMIYFVFILLIGRICMAQRKERVVLIVPLIALLFVSFI